MRIAEAVRRRTGTDVRFADLPAQDDGWYDRKKNEIVLNGNRTQGAVVRAAILHELTHVIESTDAYAAYAEIALELAYRGDAAKLAADIRAKIAQYAAHGDTLDADGARKELVAQATRNIIFARDGRIDSAVVDRIIGADIGLGRRITLALRDAVEFVKSLFGMQNREYILLRNAQRAFEEGLKRAGAEASAGGRGIQHSIVTLKNGDKFIKADRTVVTGRDTRRWAVQISNFIDTAIGEKGFIDIPCADGDSVRITTPSFGSYYTTSGKLSDFNEYADAYGNVDLDRAAIKARAAVHIDELLHVSEDDNRNAPNKTDRGGKHGDFALDGWRYRAAYFMDKSGYYQIIISVAHGTDGNVAYNISNVKKRGEPDIDGSSLSGAPFGLPLDDSISDQNKKSNSFTKISQNEKQHSYAETEKDARKAVRRVYSVWDSLFKELQKQFDLTRGGKIREADARKLAARMLKNYGIYYSVSALTDAIMKLNAYAARRGSLNFDAIQAYAQRIATEVLEDSMMKNEFVSDDTDGIRAALRGMSVRLSPQQEARVRELYGNMFQMTWGVSHIPLLFTADKTGNCFHRA